MRAARLPLRERLKAARPSWRAALGGGLAWSLAAAASAFFGIRAWGWQTQEHAAAVILLFWFGGLLAFPTALYVARVASLGRSPQVAFAAFFVALAAATIGLTAGTYALYYRIYYAQWHAETLSAIWLFQFAFTFVGALYQFAVLGLRLYMPIGLAGLFIASLWFARATR